MSHPPDENRRRIGGTATVAVCLLLLAGFAALSWSAARTKCPTFDEPLNTVGAWMILHEGDWRGHPHHPALWQYWSALPNGPPALRPQRRIPARGQMLPKLRSGEHTSGIQSPCNIVCRLLLGKKKN